MSKFLEYFIKITQFFKEIPKISLVLNFFFQTTPLLEGGVNSIDDSS